MEEATKLRKNDPKKYNDLSLRTMRAHVEVMLDFQKDGSHVFDYGNNLREGARLAGLEDAFNFPGFVPAYIRPFIL